MEENQIYRKRRRFVMGTAFSVLLLTMAAMLYAAFVSKQFNTAFMVIVIAGISVFWILTDLVAPIAGHDFEGRSKEQMTAYKAVVLADAVGYAGLIYFCLSKDSRTGTYGALVYAGSVFVKRRFNDDYNTFPGDKKEEDEESESTDTLSGAASGLKNMFGVLTTEQAVEEKRSLHERAFMNGELDTDLETGSSSDSCREETSEGDEHGSV